MTKFNYFTVLGKDDKELIHSAFIRFLLKDEQFSDLFIKELFPQFKHKLNKENIILEKNYSYNIINEEGKKVNKRISLDIEAHSVDQSTLLVIENKFKSFPYEDQLITYDNRLSEEHLNKNIIKYLLCFDTSIIPSNFDKRNWNFISYYDLLDALDVILKNSELEGDKKSLIEHYIYFLSDYFHRYEEIKKSCGYLFFDGRNRDNKFWTRLVNAMTRLKLQEYFAKNNIPVLFTVNPGSTSVPLINIFPKHWNNTGSVDILIQVQDQNLKYYCHSDDHIELDELIDIAQKGINNKSGKFNKLGPKKGRTNYIYQEKLNKTIINRPFTVDDFANRIIEFYEKIDAVARMRFKSEEIDCQFQ